uniref:Uncharacterized protein n=1 Tax=Trichinella nativa TaxID=6335 RepID=A0A0V1KJF7_9BILA
MGVCSRTNFMASRNCLSQGQAPGELSGGVLGVGFWRHRGGEDVSR